MLSILYNNCWFLITLVQNPKKRSREICFKSIAYFMPTLKFLKGFFFYLFVIFVIFVIIFFIFYFLFFIFFCFKDTHIIRNIFKVWGSSFSKPLSLIIKEWTKIMLTHHQRCWSCTILQLCWFNFWAKNYGLNTFLILMTLAVMIKFSDFMNIYYFYIIKFTVVFSVQNSEH
jgi:hypothetical protein